MKKRRTRSTASSDRPQKPPFKYCCLDTSRHGQHRFYVRVPGLPKYRMRSPYLDENGNITEAFVSEYHRVIAGEIAPPDKKRPNSWPPGTIGWLFGQYQRSKTFLEQKAATQRDKHSVLGRYCDTVGHLPFQSLRKSDVEASQMKRRETPGAADKLVKYLRALFNWALAQENIMKRFPLSTNPANGVTKINRSAGFHTWTEEELGIYREKHPLGSKARLALELMLNLGARRSDVVKLGPKNIIDGNIVFTPEKGSGRGSNEKIILPITTALSEALACSDLGEETFLLTGYGKSFSNNGFGNRMRKWCDEAGLAECSSHGLRKAIATLLAEAGATETQLMAIFGWEDPKMARHYTKAANKKKSAAAGLQRLQEHRITKNVPLSPSLESSGTKRGKNATKSMPRKGNGGPGGTRTPNQSVMSGRL